jgi:hypothetical protein
MPPERTGVICRCLFCGLTETQKQTALDNANKLEKKFLRKYSPHNSSIGSYAEGVFGALFDLPVNGLDGGDSGKDFTVSLRDKYDIKGTSHDQPRLEREPYRKICYVFIKVKRPHAHFQGFTYGKDQWMRVYEPKGKDIVGYEPQQLNKSFEELAANVEAAKLERLREKENWPF